MGNRDHQPQVFFGELIDVALFISIRCGVIEVSM